MKSEDGIIVTGVEAGSPADAAGIRTGDVLVAMAGFGVSDGLDVSYALGSSEEDSEMLDFEFTRSGKRLRRRLPAERPEDIGLRLTEDAHRACPNSCVFCFVDQLPSGLRETLYFKDEDYRLSFAFGSYITLTNLSKDDYERIQRQSLSPLYVSVHATDDRVRRRLLRNASAPPVLESLRRLAHSGIKTHTQIVIVPGVNDGDVFKRSLDDLLALDSVASVAVVPVGLTAHRDGLPSIEPVSADLAATLIDEIEGRQKDLLPTRGSRIAFAVDELYLRAGRDLPPYESYEDFPQLENGVGLLRAFERDLRGRLPDLRDRLMEPDASAVDGLRLSIVTGVAAAPFLEETVGRALREGGRVVARIVPVENTLLGPTITVAGLLPGAEMARAIARGPEADLVLLPAEAFNQEGVTIDDMSVSDIAHAAGVANLRVACDIIDALVEHIASLTDRAAGTREGTT